jgi:hypothetical protein
VADLVSPRVTRRRLLAGAAGGIGGLAVFGLLPILEGLATRTAGAAELTQARFARLMGTTFQVGIAQGRAVTIRLISVRSLAAMGPRPTGEGFSLIFSGSHTDVFGQDGYAVAHPSLGRFDMFLVPVGPTGPDQHYEAVFNRLWK